MKANEIRREKSQDLWKITCRKAQVLSSPRRDKNQNRLCMYVGKFFTLVFGRNKSRWDALREELWIFNACFVRSLRAMRVPKFQPLNLMQGVTNANKIKCLHRISCLRPRLANK